MQQNVLSPETATLTVLDAAYGAQELWRGLGDRRTSTTQPTDFFAGEVTEMDRAAEACMKNSLESLALSSGLTVLFVSEELGRTTIGNSQREPDILAIGDGVDGTGNFVRGRRCGSILSIAANADPTYNQITATTLSMFPDGQVLFAQKGGGAWLQYAGTDLVEPVVTEAPGRKGQTELLDGMEIYTEGVDLDDISSGHPLREYFVLGTMASDKLTSTGLRVSRSGSTALSIFDVATGAKPAVIEATRKGNLEVAAEYLAVTEAGGVVCAIIQDVNNGTFELQDIGDEKFNVCGQYSHILTVAAVNKAVADGIVERLNRPEPTTA